MLIDVTNLVKGESVEVKGQLANTGEEFVFSGKIIAVLTLDCDLCLNTYKTKVSGDMSEIYTRNSDSDEEVWDFSDKTIDLKLAVITNILLNMPMQAVCSEDCKGLCSICGHNLNNSDCECDKGYVNPTFEGLLNLFDDKEV